MSDYQAAQIKNAASKAVGAPVRFCNFVQTKETFRGQTIWEGVVSKYMTADERHVYAWGVKGPDGELQYVTVLQEPPIKSAQDAVSAWIVSEGRKGGWGGNEPSNVRH